VPSVYDGHALNGEDRLGGPERTRPGAPCPDARLGNGFLLDHLGSDFTILSINAGFEDTYSVGDTSLRVVSLQGTEVTDAIVDRYLGDSPSAVYLIRPDQHVAGRWASEDADKIAQALTQALGGLAHAA